MIVKLNTMKKKSIGRKVILPNSSKTKEAFYGYPFNLTNFYQSIFNEVIYTAVIDEGVSLNYDQYDDEKI